MEKITSINNELIKHINSLKQKKIRDENQEFIVEGYHLVEEAFKAGTLKYVLIVDENDAKYDCRTILTTKQIIEKIATTKTPQNIIGVSTYLTSKTIKGNKFIILDGVQDPGNFGTIIRSAIGFDIDQIIINDNTVDCYNEKVIRASQGGIFQISIIRKNIIEAISELKKKKVKVYGTDLKGTPLNKIKKEPKYAIVLGNEGNGVSDEVKNICDENILIEINSRLESLNVGVAGSILMYEFKKIC